MILGVAGGNGLEHIQKTRFKKVYGIDVNQHYLNQTAERYVLIWQTFWIADVLI